MRLLVCGGREYGDRENLHLYLDELIAIEQDLGNNYRLVIHGDARGADRLAHGWAVERGLQPVRVPALWEAHGNRAGAIRNANMLLLEPHLVVAFPGGAGTAHMVRIAKAKGIKVAESVR